MAVAIATCTPVARAAAAASPPQVHRGAWECVCVCGGGGGGGGPTFAQVALGISTAAPATAGPPGEETEARPLYVPESVDKKTTLSRQLRSGRQRSSELEEVTKAAMSKSKKRFAFWPRKG